MFTRARSERALEAYTIFAYSRCSSRRIWTALHTNRLIEDTREEQALVAYTPLSTLISILPKYRQSGRWTEQRRFSGDDASGFPAGLWFMKM